MIIALIPTSATAETLLNTLAEADFDSADISVIMRDPKARNAIASDSGPLKGVLVKDLPTKLAQAHAAAADVPGFIQGVQNGKVLVAIRAQKASEAAAVEMLNDHQAELVRVLP